MTQGESSRKVSYFSHQNGLRRHERLIPRTETAFAHSEMLKTTNTNMEQWPEMKAVGGVSNFCDENGHQALEMSETLEQKPPLGIQKCRVGLLTFLGNPHFVFKRVPSDAERDQAGGKDPRTNQVTHVRVLRQW